MIAAFLFGIAGGAVGGFAVSTFMHRADRHDRPPRGRPHRIYRFEIGGPVGRDLAQKLDLSPAQSARFDQILKQSGQSYAAVRESTRAALERVLDPDQRVEFRRMEERFVRHRRFKDASHPGFDRRVIIETDSVIDFDMKEGDRR